MKLIERFRAAWRAFKRPEITTEHRIPVTIGKVTQIDAGGPFQASGSFTAVVPPGAQRIEIHAIGAGGGGGSYRKKLDLAPAEKLVQIGPAFGNPDTETKL